MIFKARSKADQRSLNTLILNIETRLFMLFDERDYLQENPDIEKAIFEGVYESGLEHFKLFGHAERRFPGFYGFVAEDYLWINADLAKTLAKEADPLKAARLHFRNHGYLEPRLYNKTMA